MIKIFVDADACPVKAEVFRVAKRYGLKVCLVSNSKMQMPLDPLFEMKIVSGRLDAADDWIVEKITDKDIAVTSDIPLASRCLKKGAKVLEPKGRIFTQESIGDALANRDLMAYLRDMGDITGGPAGYAKRDRSRFLQHLDLLIQTILREKKIGRHSS